MTTTTDDRPLRDWQATVLAEATPDELETAERWLVAHGSGVSQPAIAAAVVDARRRGQPGWLPSKQRAKRAYWQRKIGEQAPTDDERAAFVASLNIDQTGRRLADLVAKCLERTGKAPKWSELGGVKGWTHWQTETVMRLARSAGWLTYTGKPRSLRPGKKHATEQKSTS